jgi:hypothetical protein
MCAGGCVWDIDDQLPSGVTIGEPLSWSMLDSLVCPKCDGPSFRPYRRFYLRAGRRGGKTRAGGQAAVEETIVPHSIGWCCAPSYPELEDYVMPAFFSQLPSEWFENPLTEWSEDRMSLRLPNGAEVHFRSLDDPNRAAGPGLDWLWIDEGRKVQELAWQLARPTLKERKGICWVTSSPDWGEDWCHKNFWIPAIEGRPGYWATEYKTIDNPIIDPAEVEEDRATMPPELFRREYEASIEYPSGTILGAVVDACDADDAKIRAWIPEWPLVDPRRPCIIPLDPGADHPFAAVKIVSTPHGLVQVDEYLAREKKYVEHAASLKQMAGLSAVRWCIDRSQKQASHELSQYGIYCTPAENDVDAGIQRVYAWMASGRFRIARSKCPQSLKYYRAYRWAETKESTKGLSKPAPYKKDDDLPDALRYGLMTWPELPTRSPLDGEPLQPGERDLVTLVAQGRMTDHERITILRNIDKPDREDGLLRVTDSFELTDREEWPNDQNPFGDFYAR